MSKRGRKAGSQGTEGERSLFISTRGTGGDWFVGCDGIEVVAGGAFGHLGWFSGFKGVVSVLGIKGEIAL
jgi:hypothetical protein